MKLSVRLFAFVYEREVGDSHSYLVLMGSRIRKLSYHHLIITSHEGIDWQIASFAIN